MENRNTARIPHYIRSAVSIAFKLLVIFIVAYPFLWMVCTAFKPYKETITYPPTLLPSQWVFDGLKECLTEMDVRHFMKNSIVVSFSVLLLQYLVIIPAAYAFARVKFPGRSLLFGIVLLGFMIPQQVTFVPVYLIFSKAKMLQSYWPQILPFIANAFGIFLLRQYFMQVPDELLEAARLDNASELKILGKIMLPMSKPAISAIALLSFVGHWNDYFWPLMMTRADAVRPLTVGIAALKDAEGNNNWNVIMAGNMFLVMPLVLIYIFASKFIINSFTYSGIK